MPGRKPQRPSGTATLPAPEFWWTPEQIAAMHQISKAAVLSAISRGDLVGNKPFENVVRVSDSAYRDWINRTRIMR